jgi:hypothetical protein
VGLFQPAASVVYVPGTFRPQRGSAALLTSADRSRGLTTADLWAAPQRAQARSVSEAKLWD